MGGVLPVVALWLSCASGPSVEAQPEEFLVTSPEVGAVFAREYVGQVQAVRYVELRSRLKGVVEAVGVDEGQRVKAGQLLFAISARGLQQELEKARATVESVSAELRAAQIEQANTQVLFEKKVISSAEHEVAEARVAELAARVREARANEGQAEINLSYGQVRAPFDGVVNRVPRKVGSLVTEDDLLTTMTDTSEVFVYFRVSEQEYLEYSVLPEAERQKAVTLRLANGSLYPHAGEVDAVESEFDKDSGNIAFRARFPNPEQRLKHGASGKVVIQGEAKSALVVPQRATFEIQENVYVYRVDANDIVHATQIAPRVRLKDSFVLESGLAAGDRIVVEGVQKLKDGARIVPRATTAPSSSL